MVIEWSEYFDSIDGEVNACGQGAFSTFIRLSKCNLNCPYCDTQYAKKEGYKSPPIDLANLILMDTNIRRIKKVTITGGEPLIQTTQLNILIDHLASHIKDLRATIETNGTQSIALMKSKIINWIVDYKLHKEENNYEFFSHNIDHMKKFDILKFPIENETQFNEAVKIITIKDLEKRPFQIAFSPIGIDPEILLKLMKSEGFYKKDFIFNVQIHKYIWGDRQGV